MNDQLPSLTKLLKQLQQVPYLASKNLYRVAHHFLNMDAQRVQQFCATLQEAHAELTRCAVCCAWQEKRGSCPFCASPRRDQSMICVVETWHDLYALEKTGSYTGMYHVLGGAISPLDGIAPEDLSIPQLLARLSTCKELIFAGNQTPEGEATVAYIMQKINQIYKDRSFLVTCLSRGVPIGASLESVDRVTMVKALIERREY